MNLKVVSSQMNGGEEWYQSIRYALGLRCWAFFLTILSRHLVFSVFPFPPSTVQSSGKIVNFRQDRANTSSSLYRIFRQHWVNWARIQNESVTLVCSYYHSYYELNFVGVYPVVPKRVDSVSGSRGGKDCLLRVRYSVLTCARQRRCGVGQIDQEKL